MLSFVYGPLRASQGHCAYCTKTGLTFGQFAMWKKLLILLETWYNTGKGVMPMRHYDKAQLLACVLVILAEGTGAALAGVLCGLLYRLFLR